MSAISTRPITVCANCGQTRRHKAHGWCVTCHGRWLRHGKPADGPPPPSRAPRPKGSGKPKPPPRVPAWAGIQLDSDGWRNRAACRGKDPEIFFPNGSSPAAQLWISEAKEICATCPVRKACLELALAAEGWAPGSQRDGIFGGLDGEERWSVHRSRTRARAGVELPKPRGGKRHGGGRKKAPCGTEAAYRRHVDNGEPIDDRCAQAHEDHKAHGKAQRRAERDRELLARATQAGAV